MALPTNTSLTYGSTVLREDLTDVVINIFPESNFFQKWTGSVTAIARTHEWTKDTLKTPAVNAHLEGDDATAVAVVPPVRLSNTCQILKIPISISGSMQAVVSPGNSNSLGYQSIKAMKELSNDLEYALLINSAEVTGTSAVARKTKGVIGFITSNKLTAGTARVLTTTLFNDAIKQIWTAGGTAEGREIVALCGAFQRTKISGFTGNTREIMAESKKLVDSISIYSSDHGVVVIKSHHIVDSSAAGQLLMFGSGSFWRKAWLRPPALSNLPNNGDAEKFQVLSEVALESGDEAASANIANLTVA